MSLKDSYEKKLRAQLDEWKLEINVLKAKADKADAEAQLEFYKQVEQLREMQERARNRLDTLRDASDDAWEDMKAGMESAWLSLGTAIKSAKSRFK